MKRRILSVGLVLFALWPLAQHALVRSQGVDPWRLFGWAMYCVPGPMKTVRVVEVSRDGRFAVLDPQRYDADDQSAVDVFRIRRQGLGRLESGDTLAASMLERHPDWDGVALPVLTLSLERDSAHTRIDIQQDTWWRDGSRGGFEATPEIFSAEP